MHPDLRHLLNRPGGLIHAADAAALGLQRPLRSAVGSGELRRVRRGVYVDSRDWEDASAIHRHRMRIDGIRLTHQQPFVLCYHSAAAFWGLPMVGEWPATVHLAAGASGGRAKNGILYHTVPDGVRVERHGATLVTSVADTVLAMACVLPFAAAVAMADFALHVPRHGSPLCTEAELRDCLAHYAAKHGHRAAAMAVAFADGRSDSVGESYSRAGMHVCGFVQPELQVSFADADGLIGYGDFFWRRANIIGEFDGLGKYLREEFARGRDPADVVIAEKIREDRLRAVGPSVCRWLWEAAVKPPVLARILDRAGVPRA